MVRAPIAAPERAALSYFGILFAVGFAIGTARVLLVEPRLGPAWAVAAELPFMLGASALVAGWAVRRFAIGPSAARLRMGVVALALLVAAETVLGRVAFGMPVTEQFAAYWGPRGLLTLAGQLGFGLMPLLVK